MSVSTSDFLVKHKLMSMGNIPYSCFRVIYVLCFCAIVCCTSVMKLFSNKLDVFYSDFYFIDTCPAWVFVKSSFIAAGE